LEKTVLIGVDGSTQKDLGNVVRCMKADSLLTDNCGSIEISEMEGQDIDNEVDWKLAELKYELL
jgi:N-acylneuraminate cytidylyltransferase